MSDKQLVDWFLTHLADLCPSWRLQVLCAGLSVNTWQVAPAHLGHADRVSLLTEHLHEKGRLAELAAAVLRDESLRDDAVRLGLLTLGTKALLAPGFPKVGQPWLESAFVHSSDWLHQARSARVKAKLPDAMQFGRKAEVFSLTLADGADAVLQQAHAVFLMGDQDMSLLLLQKAATLFREARLKPGPVLVVQAARALRMQNVAWAKELLQSWLARVSRAGGNIVTAEIQVVLADALRRDREFKAAITQSMEAVSLANAHKAFEVRCAAYQQQARVFLDQARYEQAHEAHDRAFDLAREHGLVLEFVDLLNLRGQLAYSCGKVDDAMAWAQASLSRSMDPACSYRWAQADSLHLLALAILSKRPEPRSLLHNQAVQHLSTEVALRNEMQDPEAPEIDFLIRRLRAPA